MWIAKCTRRKKNLWSMEYFHKSPPGKFNLLAMQFNCEWTVACEENGYWIILLATLLSFRTSAKDNNFSILQSWNRGIAIALAPLPLMQLLVAVCIWKTHPVCVKSFIFLLLCGDSSFHLTPQNFSISSFKQIHIIILFVRETKKNHLASGDIFVMFSIAF